VPMSRRSNPRIDGGREKTGVREGRPYRFTDMSRDISRRMTTASLIEASEGRPMPDRVIAFRESTPRLLLTLTGAARSRRHREALSCPARYVIGRRSAIPFTLRGFALRRSSESLT
jgi:hypothetical protein